jgi:hypothetical protein
VQCRRDELSVNPTFAARYTELVSKDAINGEIVGAWFAMIAVREMGHDKLLINPLKRAFVTQRQ